MSLPRLRTFAIFVMAALGIAFIVIGIMGEGYASSWKGWLSLVAAFGAALFGATLAMAIENLLGTELSDIQKYLFAKEKFESAADYLGAITGKWHVYYLTVVDTGLTWKSAEYVLAGGDTRNTVNGSFDVIAPNGALRRYTIEAGLRGSTLVLISRPVEGTETESIEVVPRAINTHLSIHLGIGTLETWTGELAFSGSMYSRTPLVSGNVSDQDNQKLLSDTFRRAARAQGIHCLFGNLWDNPA